VGIRKFHVALPYLFKCLGQLEFLLIIKHYVIWPKNDEAPPLDGNALGGEVRV
jgi:hypothetical protein